MSKPFDFSVLICCYNFDLDKLKKTIISIVNQKKVNFEIVITDDCSKCNYKDEIEDWCRRFNNVHFEFNFLKNNVGTINNILSALCIAKGKYIKLISPGDYLFDEYTLSFFMDNFSDDVDVLFGDAIYYKGNELVKSINPKNSLIYGKNIFYTYAIFENRIVGASLAYKKDILFNSLTMVKNKIIYVEDLTTIILTIINDKKIKGKKHPVVWYEFGSGISTGKGNGLLGKDKREFYNFLVNNFKDNKKAMLIGKLKNYDISKGKKLKFIFKNMIFFRLCYYFILNKVCNVIFKPKKYKISLEKMNNITNYCGGKYEL